MWSPKITGNRFKVLLSLTVLYALFIFYLSSISSTGDPRTILNFLPFKSLMSIMNSIEHPELRYLLYPLYIFYKYPDKVGHVIQYAIFGFLLYYTLRNSSNNTLRSHAPIFAVIIGVAYGAADELHQFFVPEKKVNILDLISDSAGILIAQAFIFIRDRLQTSFKGNRAPILDLKLAVILTLLSILFILVPPFNQTFFRI